MLDVFYCLGFADGAQPFLARLDGVVVGGGVVHFSEGTAQFGRFPSLHSPPHGRAIGDAENKTGCSFPGRLPYDAASGNNCGRFR
jgi:hypothetical protein